MFNISPQRVSAALFIALLSFAPLTVIAQETPPQNDSAPMLDLTRQPTAAPSLATPSSQASLSPTVAPTSAQPSAPLNRKTSNPANTQNPGRSPRNAPATASATPSASGVQANTAFDNPASKESAEGSERTENAESTESTVEGANIPPDPNVLDNAIHTPIYTRPMGKEPAPLDAPSNTPEKEHSAYSILAIVLWTCFLIAAAATGYFLYIRFSDKD